MGYLPHSGETYLNVLPLFNLRSGPQILAACRELKPDVVILQLGHYEAPAPVRKILSPGRSKKTHAQAPREDGPHHAEMRYRPTFPVMIAELRRIVAAGIVIATGRKRKMFNPSAIAAHLDSIILSLKELPLRGIVLVGPFSAPDPLTRFCRRKLVPIFEAAAKKHGCAFVDIFSLLEAYPKGKPFAQASLIANT